MQPEIAEVLKSGIEYIEKLAELFNGIFGRKSGQKRIDLESLRAEARDQMSRENFIAIDQAKAEALIFIGEREAALGMIERQF